MRKQRYELIAGKSAKFWEVSVKGSSMTTAYGRIGTKGQSSTKKFADADTAKEAAQKLIQQKVNKGYRKAPARNSKRSINPATKKRSTRKKGFRKAVAKKVNIADLSERDALKHAKEANTPQSDLTKLLGRHIRVDRALALCPNCHRYLHLGVFKGFGAEEFDWTTLEATARRRGFATWQELALHASPGDWPGCDMVNLDNVGDPGHWLEGHLEEEFLSDPTDDENFAEYLAESYISSHEELWGESYSDAGYFDTDELYQEFFAGIVKEFIGFIQEWRKRVLAELNSSKSVLDS